MTVVVEQIELIDLTKLEVHPSNPRKQMGDLDELAASIKSAGLIEPIVAVRHNGKYQVVAGSRRLAAARKAKLENLPVRVMDLDEAQAMAAALIENLQRKDLEPLEQAEAFRSWLTLTGKTQKELSEVVGLAPSTIANALRLLEAPKLVQDALRAKTIGAEHARVALSVPPELASGLTLKAGVTVQQLRDEATELTRAHETIAKIKANIDEARKKAEGRADHVVTWGTNEIWAGRRRVKLTEILGTPPAKIAGPISGYIQVGSYNHADGDTPLHDKTCDCRAIAPGENDYGDVGSMKRVCIKPTGYKKYLDALRTERFGKGGRKLPPKQTAATREKAKAKRDREADAAAVKALNVWPRGERYQSSANARAQKLGVEAKLLKGGIDGEPARLALFVIASKRAYLWAPFARAALWRRIQKMAIKAVRDLVVQHAAAGTAEEIETRKDEKRELLELIYTHYGIAVPEPEKPKAKKKVNR